MMESQVVKNLGVCAAPKKWLENVLKNGMILEVGKNIGSIDLVSDSLRY